MLDKTKLSGILVILMVVIPLMLSGCATNVANLPGAQPGGSTGEVLANRYVITFHKPYPGADRVEDLVTSAGGTLSSAMVDIGVAVAESENPEFAEDLQKFGEVDKVVHDIQVQWIPKPDEQKAQVLGESISQQTGGIPAGGMPAFWNSQWNMRQIEADKAWDAGYTGNPSVEVAIIDTGIDYTHIDLAGQVDMANSTSFATYDHSFIDSNFPGEPYWIDLYGHGTHVGGIVAAKGIGVAGVAPNVKLIAVKVLTRMGWGNFSWIINGVYYAAQVGADVANMSLGPSSPMPIDENQALIEAMSRAIEHAYTEGTLVVDAAGNSNLNADSDTSKWYTNTQITKGGVGTSATGPGDQKASYSNTGVTIVDVAAPGGDFTRYPEQGWWLDMVLAPCSSFSLYFSCAGGTSYIWMAGTSMAAPHASGVAALYDSEFGGAANAPTLKSQLQTTVDDLGKAGLDPIYGFGRVNAYNAVTE